MIDFVKGTLVYKGIDYAIVDHGGIGLRIYSSVYSLEQIEDGEEVHFYTYLVMREDGMFLFGFVHPQEMQMFELLITVKGVGPKVAIGVLSGLRPSTLEGAILQNDVTMLTKAPGIGKKTAERIILELKDKVQGVGSEDEDLAREPIVGDDDVIEALMSLGYARHEVLGVLPAIDDKLPLEERMKQALKRLMQ
ncbi:MAG: Holliday junction branch migration protein RuvA [Tissierellia bacterium]|nr:Holliday junction branch migration protein RuvA [Tissierellia bacterium]